MAWRKKERKKERRKYINRSSQQHAWKNEKLLQSLNSFLDAIKRVLLHALPEMPVIALNV
jgi:hypothetical protein